MQYSSDIDVDTTVRLLVESWEISPYSGTVLGIPAIIEAVRYGFGDDAAATVKITVH